MLNDRMPVILEPDAWPVWLDKEAGEHAALLRPAAAGVVKMWPVSRAVNSVRNNEAQLMGCAVDVSPLTPAEAAVDVNPM